MTQLVGILNLTPDSFSDGGEYNAPAAALERAGQLFEDGAALVDVGAESTRPGATPLTPEQEQDRLRPILGELLARWPGKISLDTYHPETVRWALALGGDLIINDVTGFTNPAMRRLVAKAGVRCIVSHSPTATPAEAHAGKLVGDLQTVKKDLLATAKKLQKAGLPVQKIMLDPGIGFGKMPELNAQLVEFAAEASEYPVMIGYSRKRFLGEQRMELGPNLEAGRRAIAAGAAYLRVHDVAGHRQLL